MVSISALYDTYTLSMTRTHCLWHVHIVYDTYTLSICIFVVCDWHPCLNGGTCVVDEIGYHCECTDCYTGSCCNVTVPSCNGNGGNGGVLPGLTCDDCHTGDNCEIRKFFCVDYRYASFMQLLCNLYAIITLLYNHSISMQLLCHSSANLRDLYGLFQKFVRQIIFILSWDGSLSQSYSPCIGEHNTWIMGNVYWMIRHLYYCL